MSNFRMPAEKIHVEQYLAQGNIIKMKLTYCPYRVGEAIDIDNENARISGQIIEKLGKYIKMRITHIQEKPKATLIN